MKVADLFLDLDIFGYKPHLHVNTNTRTHKTKVGAALSILYLLIISFCFYSCLIFQDDDVNQASLSKLRKLSTSENEEASSFQKGVKLLS